MAFRFLRATSYGLSGGGVFLALLYAFNIGEVRAIFGPVPHPEGILIVLGGLSLIFVGVGMLLARLGADRPTP